MTLAVESPLGKRSGSNHGFKNFVMELAREVETERDEEIEFETDSDRDDVDDESLYSGSDSSESEVTEARSPPVAPLDLSKKTTTKPTKHLKGPTGFLIPAFPEVPTLGLPLDDDTDLDSVSLATAKQSLEELEQAEAEDDESYASLPRAPQQQQQKKQQPPIKKESAPVATVTIDPYVNYDWMEAYHPDQVQEEKKKDLFESVCCSFLSWLPFGFKPKANALVLPENMEDEENDDLSETPKILKVSSKTRIVIPSYAAYSAAPTDLAYQMEQTGLF